MASKAASPVINTLSSARPRALPTNFGELTLQAMQRPSDGSARVNTANAFYRGPNSTGNANASHQRIRRRAETNTLLDRIVSRPPGAAGAASLYDRLRGGSNNSHRTQSQPQNKNDVRLRDRFRSSNNNNDDSNDRQRPHETPVRSLTDSSPRGFQASASEYIRPVARLDQLAAQTGIDSSAASVKPRRTYKDRFESRQPPITVVERTRFAAPRQGGIGRRGGAAAARARGAIERPGQSRERKQTKVQELESNRKAAVAARASAAPPPPIAYSFNGIDVATFSPVLQKVWSKGSQSSYSQHQALLRDTRDAARLVVRNRSIVEKQTVLKKIGTWIPEQPQGSADSGDLRT